MYRSGKALQPCFCDSCSVRTSEVSRISPYRSLHFHFRHRQLPYNFLVRFPDRYRENWYGNLSPTYQDPLCSLRCRGSLRFSLPYIPIFIGRAGKSVPGPQCTVPASSCDSAFTVPVPKKTYRYFLNFSEPVVAFILLLPTVFLQLPVRSLSDWSGSFLRSYRDPLRYRHC